jgi:hypothetical protein
MVSKVRLVLLVRLDQLESKEQRDRLALLEPLEQDQLALQGHRELLVQLALLEQLV